MMMTWSGLREGRIQLTNDRIPDGFIGLRRTHGADPTCSTLCTLGGPTTSG